MSGDLLQLALKSLTIGDHGQLVSLFRYFEDSVSRVEASKDKQIVKAFFLFLEDLFGRPDRFELVRSTAATFVNVHMESATPDLWRNSDCVFREYAFKTHFVKNQNRRPAEVLMVACLNTELRPIWLRKIELRFSHPDAETIRLAQGLFQRLQDEIKKVRGPQS